MKKHVFFDLDGSLIDTQYNFNMDLNLFKGRINQLKTNDYYFHLNSNRSLESLKQMREKLEFNGLIIYENGIGCYGKDNEENLFEKFNKSNLELLINKMNFYCEYIVTDLVVNEKLDLNKYTDGQKILFCEKSREYTMTIYPRIIQKEKLLFLDDSSILDNLKEEYLAKYSIEENERYKNIILIPRQAHKGSNLVNFKRSSVYTFGDEEADISMFLKSIYFGAPNNAKDLVKRFVIENQGFLSEKNYTLGAYDFINTLK